MAEYNFTIPAIGSTNDIVACGLCGLTIVTAGMLTYNLLRRVSSKDNIPVILSLHLITAIVQAVEVVCVALGLGNLIGTALVNLSRALLFTQEQMHTLGISIYWLLVGFYPFQEMGVVDVTTGSLGTHLFVSMTWVVPVYITNILVNVNTRVQDEVERFRICCKQLNLLAYIACVGVFMAHLANWFQRAYFEAPVDTRDQSIKPRTYRRIHVALFITAVARLASIVSSTADNERLLHGSVLLSYPVLLWVAWPMCRRGNAGDEKTTPATTSEYVH